MNSKNGLAPVPVVLAAGAMLFTLSGCRVIGDIFKAGVGVGIVAVVLVIAVVGGIAMMISRK